MGKKEIRIYAFLSILDYFGFPISPIGILGFRQRKSTINYAHLWKINFWHKSGKFTGQELLMIDAS